VLAASRGGAEILALLLEAGAAAGRRGEVAEAAQRVIPLLDRPVILLDALVLALTHLTQLRQNSDKGWQEQLCYGSVAALAIV